MTLRINKQRTLVTGIFLSVCFLMHTLQVSAQTTLSNDAGIVIESTTPVNLKTISSEKLISHTFGNYPLPTLLGIISTAHGDQNGRLYRDGIPSTCSSSSPFNVYNSGLTRHYEAYSFTAATTGCLNVTVNTTTELYVAVYSGNYKSSNYTINGIGQGGYSGNVSFSCPVVAAQKYTLVIMDVYGNGNGVNYDILLDNVHTVPVNIWWILSSFILIAGFAIIRFVIKK